MIIITFEYIHTTNPHLLPLVRDKTNSESQTLRVEIRESIKDKGEVTISKKDGGKREIGVTHRW